MWIVLEGTEYEGCIRPRFVYNTIFKAYEAACMKACIKGYRFDRGSLYFHDGPDYIVVHKIEIK